MSQRQIAERLGVSIALVSRVLSGKALEVGIAAGTIEKVLATAAEMGYVPSAAALTLKGKGSRTVGVVVYDFLDPFFGPIIEQLQALAKELDCSLVLTGFKGRHPDPSDLAPLHKHAIDGLIILGSDEQADWLGGFHHLPIARIGHGNSAEQSLRVTVDESAAAARLIQYLHNSGRRNLVFVGMDLPAQRLRLAALERAAVTTLFQSRSILSAHDAFETGLSAAREVLQHDEPVEALVCATDMIAMGALNALHDSGRTVGVTGFDDIPAAARFIPPITTIEQPVSAMAERAFRGVVEKAGPAEVLLKGTLKIRSST